ncbi:MAG: hypothetical protein EOP84_00445 [Verrucomicrobiaceae bacterium]|nr:MAG: hypothetical protein EOP84_00445 [Verrucomicrobiaceae bacterium]
MMTNSNNSSESTPDTSRPFAFQYAIYARATARELALGGETPSRSAYMAQQMAHQRLMLEFCGRAPWQRVEFTWQDVNGKPTIVSSLTQAGEFIDRIFVAKARSMGARESLLAGHPGNR